MKGIDARNLPLYGHGRFDDDRYWKSNDKQICYPVAHTHRDELNTALAAFASRIWYDLPIVIEGLAFRESCDDHSDKGDDEEPADALQAKFIRPFPYMIRETFEKFCHREFGNPQASLAVSSEP